MTLFILTGGGVPWACEHRPHAPLLRIFHPILHHSRVHEVDHIPLLRQVTLTLYGPNLFFRRFSGHDLR